MLVVRGRFKVSLIKCICLSGADGRYYFQAGGIVVPGELLFQYEKALLDCKIRILADGRQTGSTIGGDPYDW